MNPIRRSPWTVLAGLIFCAQITLGSQQPWNDLIRFDRFTTRDGLIRNTIRTLFQDRQGFLWIGTLSGLCRFDGSEFKKFPSVPDLEEEAEARNITAICDDPSGRIWISVAQDRIDCYDPDTEQFRSYSLPSELTQKQESRFPSTLLFSQHHPEHIWIGCRFGSIIKMTLHGKEPAEFHALQTQSPPDAPCSINTLCEDQDGILWIGSSQGLWRLEPQMNAVRVTHVPLDCSLSRRPDIRKMTLEADGCLWMSVNGGLIQFHPKTGRIVTHPLFNEDAESLLIKDHIRRQDGQFWLASYNNGLILFDPVHKRSRFYRNQASNPASISNNNCHVLLLDRSKHLWIGTYTGGLNRFDPFSQRFAHLYHIEGQPNTLQGNQIKALASDSRGNIWTGGELGMALNCIDTVSGSITRHFCTADDIIDLRGMRVLTLQFDESDNIWISNNNQLIFIDRRKRQYRTFTHQTEKTESISPMLTRVSQIDPKGYLWLGSMTGVDRIDRRSGKAAHFSWLDPKTNSRSHNVIRAFHIDQQQRLWIGAENGIWLFDDEREQFRVIQFSPPGKKRNVAVFSLLTSTKNPDLIWVGTNIDGLFLFDFPRKRLLKSYHIRNGLPNNHIYSIQEDSGGLIWVSTNQGIASVNPTNDEINCYDSSDGVQGEEFNSAACQSRSGLIMMGGQNGLNIFDPRLIVRNRQEVKVRFTDFQLFNRSIHPSLNGPLKRPLHSTRRIDLLSHQSMFSLEFTAMEFGAPQKIRYAYKMEGYDRDWFVTPPRRRFATYTNLPSGRYTFMVKASNRDGVWNTKPETIDIVIQPPFWKSTLFYWILALAAGLILFFLQQIRSHKRRLEEIRELETEQKMIQASEEVRQQVGMELHDGLSHDLLAVDIHLKLLQKQLPPEESRTLQGISEMLRKATAKTRRMARGLFPINLTEYGLPHMLNELSQKIEAEFFITCRLDCDEALVDLSPAQLFNFYYIANEAVHNAARHARAQRIDIHLKQNPAAVSLIIRDNGTGMRTDEIERSGMGLRIMAHRARLMGADFQILPTEPHGCTIQCRLSRNDKKGGMKHHESPRHGILH